MGWERWVTAGLAGWTWTPQGGAESTHPVNDEWESKTGWAKSWNKNTCMNFKNRETLCLAKQGDWESAGGNKTMELDEDMMVEQDGWRSRSKIQMKYWCRRSPTHTSWSVSMRKCQGCPTVKKELWMNFSTYHGKMKAVQSWTQQTLSLLCLETGTICACQHIWQWRWKKSHKFFQLLYPKTASTSDIAASINTEYGKKKIIQLSLRLKQFTQLSLFKTNWENALVPR